MTKTTASDAPVEHPPTDRGAPASVRRAKPDRPSAAVQTALAALRRRAARAPVGLQLDLLDGQLVQRGALDPGRCRLNIGAAPALGERTRGTPPESADVSFGSNVKQAYVVHLPTIRAAFHADVAPGRLRARTWCVGAPYESETALSIAAMSAYPHMIVLPSLIEG